jgi:hypothetical protein
VQESACSIATATAVACPACVTLELAQSCAGYVTSVINSTDVVPCFNAVTLEKLRQEVLASSWFDSFRSDMRSSSILYRAAEGSIRAVGYSTYWTASSMFALTRATGGLLRSCVTQRCVFVPPGDMPFPIGMTSFMPGSSRAFSDTVHLFLVQQPNKRRFIELDT